MCVCAYTPWEGLLTLTLESIFLAARRSNSASGVLEISFEPDGTFFFTHERNKFSF